MSLEETRFTSLGSNCHLLGIGLRPGSLSRAEAWVASMHLRFSRFLPDSEVSRLNASAGAWVEVSGELEAMLRSALEAYEESGGLVHVGVLGSMLAIGYTRPLAEGPTPGGQPAEAPQPLPEMLEVRPRNARLRPGSGIDLGGLAKGWLADRLSPKLGRNSLVNLGGDLQARGGGPEGEGWPVALGGATLMLRDQGAATSGTWRRRWAQEGRAVHHLIDPRTGRPALSDLKEVSVVAPTATAAEVWAKTAVLLGSSGAEGFLSGRALAWCLD
jgi:thiamine biosynthesis lipoprotein